MYCEGHGDVYSPAGTGENQHTPAAAAGTGDRGQLKLYCWSEAKEKQEGKPHLEGSSLAKSDCGCWGIHGLRFGHLLVQYFNLIGKSTFA